MVSKVLTLDTQIGSQVLLPTKLGGQEGVSIPFSYELTMVSSSRDVEDITNNPATSLVGTMARIGILTGPKDTDYTHRTGMISKFEKSGTFNPGGVQHNLSVYQATLVPAVQMLGRQSAFRIFENADVVKIINALLADMKSRFPNFLFDMSRLKSSDFQVMEYCVQYGESTFGFLTRLMERFGIWYIFDNTEEKPQGPGSNNDPVIGGDEIMMADNTTMVLGRLPFTGFNSCDVNTHKLADSEPSFSNGEPKEATITNFRRLSNPVLQNSWFGNFNMLNPTAPIRKSERFADPFNVLVANTSVGGFFQSEEFPGRFENDPGAEEGSAAAGQGDRVVKDYADTRIQQQRVLASNITGATINPTFKAGRTFKITADQNSRGEPGEYLITYMTIAAFENSYQTETGTDVLNFFFRDLLFSPFQSGKKTRDFFLSGITASGLNNYLQNQQSFALQSWWWPSKQGQDTDFLSFFAGGITTAGISGAIPLLLSATDKALEQNDGAYANTFVALQKPSSGVYLAPTPAAGPRPIAYGPHLAVVIGRQGVDGKQEVYADAIGRVRVRFPWDPGPPTKADELPTPWSSLDPPDQPFHSGDNTCWVRVSEGWAGQKFGSQFLPRNGQEVLVGFIDGNPERPIIIGRVYNASSGVTNLPYPANSVAQKILNKLSDLKGTASDLLLRSGIKTRSVPQPKSEAGFHMLRFDDTGGSEQLLLRSQGRLDVTALHSHYETTKGNRHVLVQAGKDDKGNTVGGGSFTTVGGEYDLHVGDFRYENVEKGYQLTVKQDVVFDVEGKFTAYVNGIAGLSADSIMFKAHKKISFVVGQSQVVITPSGVYLDGALVKDHTNMTAGLLGDADILDAADAAKADPGEPPNWLALQPKGGGGGGRKPRHLGAKTATSVYALPDGNLAIGSPQSGIRVKPDPKDPDFADSVVNHIEDTTGDARQQIVSMIKNKDKPVVIQRTDPPSPSPTSTTTTNDPAAAIPEGQPTGLKDTSGKPVLGTGKGSGSTVNYDPNSPNGPDALDGGLQQAAAAQNGTVPPNSYHSDQPWPPPPPHPASPSGVPSHGEPDPRDDF